MSGQGVPQVTALLPSQRRDGDTQRYLTFSLQDEVYALDILEVTEIIEFRSLTVVPMMPSFIRGVINLRDRVLPVLDLASRFGQGPTQVSKRTGIVVVDTSGSGDGGPSGIGVIVDSVNKVVHLGAEDIEPPPAFGAGVPADFIRGMARLDDHFVVLLDIAGVLSRDEFAMLGQAADEGAGIARRATATPLAVPVDEGR